jgi:hypothetical protein
METGGGVKEYDLYVPLLYNDGEPVEAEKLSRLKTRLIDQFGGLTHFPQENEGFWKIGNVSFRDQIVILRVLTDEPLKAQLFLAQIKKEMKKDWQQQDVLIVAREVKIV